MKRATVSPAARASAPSSASHDASNDARKGTARSLAASFQRCARSAALCVAAVLVAACATPAPPTITPDVLWTAEGRVSIQAVVDGQNRIDTARFAWTERVQTSDLALYSPFGDTLAQVHVEPDRAVLRLRDRTATAASPDQLIERELGIALPVTGLRRWMRGQDGQGRVRAPNAFEEDGWRIAYPQMDEGVPALPHTVRLERAGPTPVDVRIAIERWNGTRDAR